jgi:hypothetical protein
VLLAEKKISKEQKQGKKFGPKKRKEYLLLQVVLSFLLHLLMMVLVLMSTLSGKVK